MTYTVIDDRKEDFMTDKERRGDAGQLYLCATPIGNLEDITMRVLRTLKEVDLIAAEDTRNTIKLLNHFEIRTPMTSYHEYNKVEKAAYLVDQMKNGVNVALVTDAGTPGISDPGEELVRQCWKAGVTLTSLPGPAACISALIISGQPTRRFCFEAFLPTDKKERKEILEELKNETRTIVLYEAPHRLLKTVEELYETLGDREVSFCKELTKLHENVYQTTLSQAISRFQGDPARGEFVIVIRGKSREEIQEESIRSWETMTLEEHMQFYVRQDIDRKEAMRMVAKDRGISKRDVYQALLNK